MDKEMERIKLVQEQLHKLHEILFPHYISIWVRWGLGDRFLNLPIIIRMNNFYSEIENEPSTKYLEDTLLRCNRFI